MVYLVHSTSNSVTVINGATNSTTTIATGLYPYSLAVNPATNKVYVVNVPGNNVTIIDGATNSTTTVNVATNPTIVAVNPITNKIYVACQNKCHCYRWRNE